MTQQPSSADPTQVAPTHRPVRKLDLALDLLIDYLLEAGNLADSLERPDSGPSKR